jgi:two-component system sensor histidine kinase AtoS
VRRLSKVEAAVVELARALASDPVVLVLDEPAGRFTADEMQALYGLVQEARAAGKAVLYAATTLDEVFHAADRVSILKAGRLVGTQDATALDREELVGLAYSFTESREELVRKNIELLKYKRYNEEIISSLPVGAVILDTEGRVYLANAAARAFLGTEGPELGELLARVEAGARAELIQAAREGRRGEWRRVPVEGGRTLSVRASPFHDPAGRALGIILALQDVTEELATREYLARAERASSAAELAAGVAHEVNNPLAIISNYVELVLMDRQDESTAARLAIVRDEIKRIHRIVSSLLPFARIGGAALEDADLVAVVAESVLLLAHEAERRGVRLERSVPPEPLRVKADPSRIKQVIINLVVNALEALPAGGRIRFALERASGGGTVVLRVEDDGPGVAPEALSSLFQPFSATTKPGHAGLGLSVCKHIVEAHGGAIACQSAPGRTVFTVALPVAGPRVDPAPTAPGAVAGSPASDGGTAG